MPDEQEGGEFLGPRERRTPPEGLDAIKQKLAQGDELTHEEEQILEAAEGPDALERLRR